MTHAIIKELVTRIHQELDEIPGVLARMNEGGNAFVLQKNLAQSTLLTNMQTSAQDKLDYDQRDYLVNVQQDCMRSSIPNKEMTIHRFFLVP